MPEIHLDIEDRPPTLDDARFIYTAGQIARACQARASSAKQEAERAKKLFLELIVTDAPRGVTIDPSVIDVENLPISTRAGTSSITYSSSAQGGQLEIPMSRECETALRQYQVQQYQIKTWDTRHKIFSREAESRVFLLSLSEVIDYEVFTSA